MFSVIQTMFILKTFFRYKIKIHSWFVSLYRHINNLTSAKTETLMTDKKYQKQKPVTEKHNNLRLIQRFHPIDWKGEVLKMLH